MDKKNSYSRHSSKALTSENRKSADSKKHLWPRNARRRENPNYTNSKFDAQRYSKPGPSKSRPNYDKRPKPRGGNDSNGLPSNNKSTIISSITSAGTTRLVEDELSSDETDQLFNYENELLNSVYVQGSKKQNLNHLLNFHCAPREDETSIGGHYISVRNGNGQNRKNLRKNRYNKEQFLQANFQFVINSNAEPFITSSSPDTLIDWSLIEQINIQTTEEPQCPICLYPPIAAKLTRCGHAYCWPCILHYLALTDKSWRKCPICYEAVHLNDLKSTIIVQQKNFIVGDIIKLQLMRREKGSILIEKIDNSKEIADKRIPHISKNIESGKFSKFLLATGDEILSIVKREQDELSAIFNENYPEFIFVQQALDLLEQRKRDIFEKVIIESGNKQNVEDENNVQDDDEISEVLLKSAEEKTVESQNKQNSEYECTIFNYERQLQSVEQNIIAPQIDKDAHNECSIGYLDIQLDNTIDNSKYKTNTVSTLTKDNCNIKEASKFYYFYQSVDGQNIFLHSLNVKMLQYMYGSLNQGPIIIEAKILQKEVLSMNEDLRKKITCLGHLPLTCQFEIVEIQLEPPIISELISEIFKEDILARKKNRLRRKREEMKREKEINEINERQMGKLIARSANIDIKSKSQFPTCGEESFPSIIDYKLDSQPTTSVSPQRVQFKNTSFANVLTKTPTKEDIWPSLDGLSSTPLLAENKKTTIWGTPLLSQHHTIERSERFSESDDGASVSVENDLSLGAKQKLGDVIADALLQTKLEDRNHGNVVYSKKKKNKKMLVFSTGMSFNGN